jgi:mRNA-degrading endonuclease RelE of RelBE toxin-antitoxin system
MSYRIIWGITALKNLRRIRQLDPPAAKQLINVILTLADEPSPPTSVSLDSGFHRLRRGDYRVMYKVSEPERIVHVLNVARLNKR